MRVLPNATAATPRIVPERIREAREAGGFTTDRFADELGVTRRSVGQYEIRADCAVGRSNVKNYRAYRTAA